MKKMMLLLIAVTLVVTLGCEGNTTGMNRHKLGHHPDDTEKTDD